MKRIEIIALNEDGFEELREERETIKDARRWIKEVGHDPKWWQRRSETEYAHESIHTIQLWVGGECRDDWFPKFFKSSKPCPSDTP